MNFIFKFAFAQILLFLKILFTKLKAKRLVHEKSFVYIPGYAPLLMFQNDIGRNSMAESKTEKVIEMLAMRIHVQRHKVKDPRDQAAGMADVDVGKAQPRTQIIGFAGYKKDD